MPKTRNSNAVLKSLVAVLLIHASTMVTPATAQQAASDSAMRWFDDIDVDKDGAMTTAEMVRVRDKRFSRLDGNADGQLTIDEYVFGVPPNREDEIERVRRRFAIIDTDQDGYATKEEYMAFGDRVMQTADLDGDGRVLRQEFAASVGQD